MSVAMEKRLRCTILKNKDRLKHISALELRPLLLKHQIFTISMLDDICNNSLELFDELVTRGPHAFDKFVKVLQEGRLIQEANILDSDVRKISKRLCYKIQSEPLGMCLIINNVNFPGEEDRIGSDVDADNLFKIFEEIGFLVLPERNLTAVEMTKRLLQFSVDSRLRTVDSCIVIIMSHGRSIDNLDVIFGIDSEHVKKLEIIEMFSNSNCPNLLNKPKIFIFQACRGKEEDDGVYSLCSVESSDASKAIVSEASRNLKVSSLSDILVIHSALPYHKSYRHCEKGSWLCQDLVEVLSEYYLSCDFETILKFVARKIQNRLSVDGKKKQGIHLEPINLQADIYFNKTTEYEYLI